MPETSTQKFYQVSADLQDAFRGTKTRDAAETKAAGGGGFSLLSTFDASEDKSQGKCE